MKSSWNLVKGASLFFLFIILSGCSIREPEKQQLIKNVKEGKTLLWQIQDQLLAEDKQEAEKEKTYWTIRVEDYQVSLKDLEPGTSLKLVFCKDGSEAIAHIFQKGIDYEDAGEVEAEAFENLLGHNGFWLRRRFQHMDWVFFNTIQEGTLVCLAYSWGTEYRPSENYMVDIDKDGDFELICNVTFGGDGAERTYIYHYSQGQIWESDGTGFLDEPYDDWGVNSLETEYLAKEDMLRVWFWREESGGYESKDYKISLEQLEMHPYDAGKVFKIDINGNHPAIYDRMNFCLTWFLIIYIRRKEGDCYSAGAYMSADSTAYG